MYRLGKKSQFLSRHPLTQLEIIGFVYLFYVYDGNKPLAPILRQRQYSLMYDVYWLAWWLLLSGSKYLENILESELNITGWIWILNNKIELNKQISLNENTK